MNKSELIEAVAERAGSDQAAARRHVDAVFETVMDGVSAGDRVVVTGFGTFDRVSRPARTARNPRTGAPIEVPATEAPRFRVGQTFRARVAGTAAAAVVEEPPAAIEELPAVVEEPPAVEPASPKKPKKDKKAAAKSAPKAKAAKAAPVESAPKAKAPKAAKAKADKPAPAKGKSKGKKAGKTR